MGSLRLAFIAAFCTWRWCGFFETLQSCVRYPHMHSSVTKISAHDDSRLGPGGWFAIVVLLGFLVAALAYAIHSWNALGGVTISVAGWMFMGLGVLFTLLVGGGLMALPSLPFVERALTLP